MARRTVPLRPFAAAAAALSLAACNPFAGYVPGGSGPEGNATDSAGTTGSAGTRSAPSATAKLNGYVEGYNALVSTFGLSAQFRQYLGQQIDRKTVNDPVFVLPGWLDNGLGDIKKARAMSGDLPQIDAAADRLLPVLDRLVTELKGLQSYYQSRGQLADNFARGKRENPQVIADFKAALAANDQFSAAIDAEQARRDDAELASLKAQGDMIGYDGALAINRSKKLVNLFGSVDDTRDPARLQRGDALVGEIAGASADLRQQLAAAKGRNDIEHGLRNSMYDSMAGDLDSMIGAYRELRHTGNPIFYQGMVSSYNRAVDNANRG